MCNVPDAPMPRAKIKLKAVLSPDGQRDALRKGFDPAIPLDYEVTPDDPLWERVVALDPDIPMFGHGAIELWVNRPAEFWIENSEPEGDWFDRNEDTPWWPPEIKSRWGDAQWLHEYPASAEEMVAIAEQRRAEIKYQREEVAEKLDEVTSSWERWTAVFLDKRMKEYSEFVDDPDITEKVRGRRKQLGEVYWFPFAYQLYRDQPENLEAATTAIKRGLECRDRISQVYTERENRRRKQALVAEATAWVEEFGSPRLRKALAAGLIDVSLGAYRDERLAHEHPGWQWHTADMAKEARPINNPSEVALDVLLEARKWDPDAYLQWWPGGSDEDGYPIVVTSFLDRSIFFACRPGVGADPYDV